MRLVNTTNVMALMDEESIRKLYHDDFNKLIEVDSWAFKNNSFINNFDILWPVINGKILSWGYDFSYMKDINTLLELWKREYSYYVIPDHEMPLLIKIKRLNIDKEQIYFAICPILNSITD